jgi:Flp pilus assembly protein TadD
LTDEEILAAAKAGCTKLDIEHLLHAATLTDNVAEKSAIYELAANTYGDARAYNNLGVCKVLSGDLKGAKAAFEKAEAQPEVAGNLAAVALAMGDLESAKKYLSSADAEAVKATQGALALAEGNYQEAKTKLTGYNLAIAELCDNNIEGAKEALKGVKFADADYLRAIIAIKEGDANDAISYLQKAIKAKPELKETAKNDITFTEIIANL